MESDASNTLLEEQVLKYKTSGVVEIPILTINNRFHAEKPSARYLFDELCSQFWESTMEEGFTKSSDQSKDHMILPEVCETCGSCANVMGCLEAGRCVSYTYSAEHSRKKGNQKRGGHGWTIAFLLVAAGAAGGAYVYYKRREHMGEGGHGLLDGYMQLSSGST